MPGAKHPSCPGGSGEICLCPVQQAPRADPPSVAARFPGCGSKHQAGWRGTARSASPHLSARLVPRSPPQGCGQPHAAGQTPARDALQPTRGPAGRQGDGAVMGAGGTGTSSALGSTATARLRLSGAAAGSGHEAVGLRGLSGKIFHLVQPQTAFSVIYCIIMVRYKPPSPSSSRGTFHRSRGVSLEVFPTSRLEIARSPALRVDHCGDRACPGWGAGQCPCRAPTAPSDLGEAPWLCPGAHMRSRLGLASSRWLAQDCPSF